MTTTPPEAPPSPPSEGPRVDAADLRDLSRLRRTSGPDAKVAGVCGGIARHTDVDPLVIRVLMVVLALFGAGLLLYAVAWLVVPRDDGHPAAVRLDDRSRTVALALTCGVAALVLIGRSIWGFPWPLAVAGAVVLVVMLARGTGRTERPARPQETSEVPSSPDPSTPTAPLATIAQAPVPSPPPSVPPRPYRGPVLFWWVLVTIGLGEALLGLAAAAGGGITPSAYPALAVGVCAVALLVGAFWGRAGGVVLIGLVATFATVVTTVVHAADAGRLVATPVSASGVMSHYRLSAGELDLDLTGVADPAALDGRTIHLDVGFGRVRVLVPPGEEVTVTGGVHVGDREVFGDDSSTTGTTTRTTSAPDAPHLTLDVHVGVGQVDVETSPSSVGAPR